jgi:thiopeptide-type bacteriocin biosynthesis protein
VTARSHGRIPRRLYDPLGWVVVRAPALPVEAYLALTDRFSNAADRWRTDDGTAVPADPWVRLALAVGGGRLLRALREKGEQDPGALGKLLRYQIRMSTRPTPYGLFAGVALGEFGQATDVTIAATVPMPRARPDMGWLLSFAGSLEARAELRRQLRIAAHPAVFKAAGRVFLSDRTPMADGSPSAPVSIRESPAARAALAHARTPIPYAQLADTLCALPGADAEKIEQLLTELWEQGLLLTDLRPPLTTASPAAHVASKLSSLADPPPEAGRLREAIDALAAWSRLSPVEAAHAWPALEDTLRTLHRTADPPIQVDLGLALESATVSTRVAHEAARAAELLLRLTPVPRGAPHLSAYRAAFESRYGRDREVPLLELLYPHFGLGPPGYERGASSGIDDRRLAARNEALQAIALEARAERRMVVELDEATLARLATWEPMPAALPLSLDLCVSVIAPSAAAIDRGEFLIALAPALGARQAGRYLGRFADLLGPPARQALGEIASAEVLHAPRAIWAELVYLPRRLRSANVAIRPAIRDHELAVGVSPGVPQGRTIPLDELVVGVRDGRLRLRWPVRDAEVLVRAGHMLTNFQAPGVCAFLDDLAEDGVAQLTGFDWGPAASHPFLPRIQSGRIVLSPARWRISALLRDAELPASRPDFPEALARFRERWSLPRYVYLAIGDNRLLLDLENPDHAEELRAELARIADAGAVMLQEALPGPEHAWAQGPDGRYLTELVIPLVLRPPPNGSSVLQASGGDQATRTTTAASAFTRSRPPGSDWLFVKVYCPRVLEEELLVGAVRDFCDEISRAGLSDGWFFVRYSDPDSHIRLRFRGDPNRLVSRLMPELCSWCADLMADGLCQRFAFDTYDREVERYGGPSGMAAAEALFTAESPAAVDLLALLRSTPSLDRLIATVASIDDLLASLGLGEIERLDWYRNRVTSRLPGAKEFREHKADLRTFLSSIQGLSKMPVGDDLTQIFDQRRRLLAPVAARFVELDDRGELIKPRGTILQSVVHMHCNRLADNDPTIEERALGVLLRARQSINQAPP